MKQLRSADPVEFYATDGERTFAVTCVPAGVILREKGRRLRLGPLPWGALYDRAAKLTAGVIVEEKAAAKRRPDGGVKLKRRVRRGVL